MPTDVTRILLVEDNPADADLIRERLDDEKEAPPYEIEHEYSLKAALERLSVRGIDLILLDLGLPDSHGLPTVTHVVKKAPSVPLVVISGFDDPQVKRQAMDASARDFIPKGSLDGRRLVEYIRGARAQESLPDHSRAGSVRPMVIQQVLIFEPDEGMFLATHTVLRLLGYNTSRAANPVAVMAQASNSDVDLILLGLGSGIDEPQLIERIRAVTSTPIIALFPPDRVALESLPTGVEVWLSKPASGKTLKESIERIAGSTPAASERLVDAFVA